MNPKETIGKGKLSMSVVPSIAFIELASAMKFGADKYGAFNFRDEKIDPDVYIDAIYRHLIKYQIGESEDKESQISHLGHIMANCAILLDCCPAYRLAPVTEKPRISKRLEVEEQLITDREEIRELRKLNEL